MRPLVAVGLGYLFGLTMLTLAISWVHVLGTWIAALLIVFMALFFGLLGLALTLVSRLRWWPLAAACCWVLEDPFGGHGEMILVVDDEPAICMITRKNLEAHGYKVLTARSGFEAVDLMSAQEGKVRVVVTDMMMPGMDGPATIRALRKVDPKVRVIA